jgi:hypothetical protein
MINGALDQTSGAAFSLLPDFGGLVSQMAFLSPVQGQRG